MALQAELERAIDSVHPPRCSLISDADRKRTAERRPSVTRLSLAIVLGSSYRAAMRDNGQPRCARPAVGTTAGDRLAIAVKYSYDTL